MPTHTDPWPSGFQPLVRFWARLLVLLTGATILFIVHPVPSSAQDSGRHRRLAELAESYEWQLRGYAPFPARSGFPCDEVVGRFCIRYGEGKDAAFQMEGPDLLNARRDPLDVLRASVTQLPHDTLVSGRLVRVLLEARDSPAAVDAALAFAAADTTDAWSWLLLGLALEADGQIPAAERAFAAALPRMAPAEQRRMNDVRALLSEEERRRYAALGTGEREAYVAAAWRAAYPLYLTEGNETRAQHRARYVYARLLGNGPLVPDVPRWGEDLEELTRRFGVPVGSSERTCAYEARVGRRPTDLDRMRLQLWTGNNACEGEMDPLAGYYHPDQLTYVPPQFSRERLPPPAEPGAAEWFYGPVARENGFLPRTVRAMRPLEHQLSRFPLGDSTVLRADVAFELDDMAPANGPVELGLFVLDSTLAIIGEGRDTVTALGRFAWGGLETRLPEDAWAYGVEAREMGTWQAARSRHPLPAPPEGSLTISDLVLLPARTADQVRDAAKRGDAAFRPFGSLLLDRDQEVTMYLEVRGLVQGDEGLLHYRMDLRVVKGNEEESGSGTLTWTDEHPPVEMLPVTADLGRLPGEGGVGRAVAGLTDLLSGGGSGVLQTLVLTVTDLVSGESSTVRRLVKVR